MEPDLINELKDEKLYVYQEKESEVEGADPYGVYATYQHAQKEVSLTQSRKYSINKNGYGGVVKFDSSVASKYDKTEGLYVRWSINEVR